MQAHDNTTGTSNWIFSQIGARQHFALPRAMQKRGALRWLFTDAWCRWGQRLCQYGPGPIRSFGGRYSPDLPSKKVISFTSQAVWDFFRYRMRLRMPSRSGLYDEWHRVGRTFASRVCQHLERQSFNPSRDVFCGFTKGCLETVESLKGRSVTTIVDKIDLARTEENVVIEEINKWPGWQRWSGRVPDTYYERVSAEWERANLVLVNSE